MDPFAPGPYVVETRTFSSIDAARSREYQVTVWQAADSGSLPVVLYSHSSGGDRHSAAFLCEHLASHGYLVAAIDHAERFAPELQRTDGETPDETRARVDAMIANRVPDVRLLLDRVLADGKADPARVGIVGHSFGGWTALATPEVESRVRSVVALAPAGNSRPRPGIIWAKLTFEWGRDVPTLYLAGDADASTPLAGIRELYDRTRATKRLAVLRDADHMHFVDDVVAAHEQMRAAPAEGDLAWIAEMRPIGELCPPETAHAFVRALTLAHFEATLRGRGEAQDFLDDDLERTLADRGIGAEVAA